METPKEYYYTYYSYEEWGRGYIGSRKCCCLPEEDVKYFGSYSDKTFRPTKKIILKSNYLTREDAYADEIILHDFYNVTNNPHFANRAKLTTTSFYYPLTKEEASIRGKRSKELNVGFFSLTPEQKSENSRLGGKIGGVKGGKIGGKKVKELGIGIFALTTEERKENARKFGYKGGSVAGKITGKRHKENKTGIFGRTEEQKKKDSSKGGKISGKITSSQRWQCTETGFISTPPGLTRYQNKRNIDTKKRIRLK